MSRTPVRISCALLFVVSACAPPAPDVAVVDEAGVVAEIEAALREEIRSFETKDCTAALTFFGDQEPLFVVGGRAMARRADLEEACPRMTARIPDGARRPIASERIYATGPESGYSVTEFTLPVGPGGGVTSQFVTKIWTRRGGVWRIVHVHESVAPPPSSP